MKLREDYFFEERFERAWIKFKLGDFEETLEILQEYDEVLPGNEEVELLLCDCLLQLDMLEDSERKITKSMTKGTNEEAWLHLMLRLCFEKGDFIQARPYGLKLVSLDPHNSQYVRKYAQTYTLEEDFFSASRIASDYFSSHKLDLKSIKLMILLLFSSSFIGDLHLYEESKQKLIRFANREDAEDRMMILQSFKKELEVMAPVHYFYVDLLNVISEINSGKSQDIETWLRRAREKKMKNVFYYPDSRANVLEEANDTSPGKTAYITEGKRNHFAEEVGGFFPEDIRNTARKKDAGKGSKSRSIVFGIVVGLFLHPLFGIASGMLWYYRAGKIQQLWNGLGFAIFVSFYIFLLMIKLAS